MQVHFNPRVLHTHCTPSLSHGPVRSREPLIRTPSACFTSLHAFSPKLSLLTFQSQRTLQPCRRFPKIVSASTGGSEAAARDQVSKRLANIARNLRRLGTIGFWGQLVCSVVSAIILAFSVAISGSPTSQVAFYATAGGIIAAFLSVFWSFGYVRLSDRLRKSANDLSKVHAFQFFLFSEIQI
ncbi:hypothetical protein KP509_15G034300 [Ceratopteris richardii]|uniref:Protein TIC 21, chloroplastic n=1 Tax=Ceratopteris richardii TaxID=49495 RepID=A0A8T2T3C0_CERRI|nr:hypothetical protein KP509_15G034300 [Ceratopteris richardii]